jgi:hypothetical protein
MNVPLKFRNFNLENSGRQAVDDSGRHSGGEGEERRTGLRGQWNLSTNKYRYELILGKTNHSLLIIKMSHRTKALLKIIIVGDSK